MKHFFAVLFFAAPLFLQGQEIKVNVVFKNEPLPYTYISVNKTPVAITNASGIAGIPVSKISLGDTITSSMIGMFPVSVIYDQRIQQNLSCELVHTTEDVYNLSEVVATGYGDKSSRQILRNVAKMNFVLQNNCFVSAKFTYIITLSDGMTYPVTGSFVLENKIPKGQRVFLHYFNIPPQIETKSDTTNLSRELQESIHFIYRQACGIISQLQYEQWVRPYSNMSYLGLREGRHSFNYSNSNPRIKDVLQILFEINSDSQELTNAKFTNLNVSDDNILNVWGLQFVKIMVNVSCHNISIPPKGKTIRTAPKEVEATIIKPDGSTIDLKIYDTSIKFQ